MRNRRNFAIILSAAIAGVLVVTAWTGKVHNFLGSTEIRIVSQEANIDDIQNDALISTDLDNAPVPVSTHHTTDKICVLHAGPHKTGSSTLQTFMIAGNNKPRDAALAADNYESPNIPHFPHQSKEHATLAGCLHSGRKFCKTEDIRNDVLGYFQSFVNGAASRGSNILLSSEEFDHPDLNTTALAEYLVPEYKIHVVVYYRRYYDWIHSFHNQENKNIPKARTFVEWFTGEMNFEPLLSVSPDPRRLYPHCENSSPLAVYNRFKEVPGVFNVSVVNMHEDHANFNTYSRFVCDHLDNATHMCELAKEQKNESKNNPSKNLQWDILRKRIPYYHSIRLGGGRDERLKKVEEKFFEMTDAPQICLPQEYKDKLLKMSIEAEMTLTPESWYNSEEGLESLKADFEGKINSKLCDIDIDAVLTSDEWQTFLTELEKEKGII